MNASEILSLTLTEVADALARGDISSVRVTEAAIARARKLGPVLNCFALLETDDALRDADAAVLVTAWPELAGLAAERMVALMRTPLVIDGRGMLARTERAGIEHWAVGQGPAAATTPEPTR